MLSRKQIYLTIIMPLFLAASFLAAAMHPAYTHAEFNECNIDIDLQGTIDKSVGNRATIINYSQNQSCDYDATLALYDVPLEPNSPKWIDTQTLITSKTVNVKAGETVEITVDGVGSSCRIQSDLIRGNEEYIMVPPFYWNAIDVAVYTVGDCGDETATPTPTSTPTPTVTNTPTPGPTNTPAPGPSNTPVPGGSLGAGQTGQVASVLASTGNTAFIYAIILTGAITLTSGLILNKFSK